MDNIFKEQLVKREKNSADTMKKVGIIVAAFIIMTAGNILIPSLGIFIGIGAIAAAVFFIQRLNQEYEYIFTNGELDIDIIYNRSKRKRGLSLNIKKVELVAPVLDDTYKNELSRFEKLYDFSSGNPSKNTFAVLFTHEGKKSKLIFDPNDKILEAIKQYVPRKLKWSRYGY